MPLRLIKIAEGVKEVRLTGRFRLTKYINGDMIVTVYELLYTGG